MRLRTTGSWWPSSSGAGRRAPSRWSSATPTAGRLIANAPFLDDGTPMPTRYWLCDPYLLRAVSRLESTGGFRDAEAAVPAHRIAAAHAAYAAERDTLIVPTTSGPAPRVGGRTRAGVKCLHAHLAWWLTGDDPVGSGRPAGSASTRRDVAPRPHRGDRGARVARRPW